MYAIRSYYVPVVLAYEIGCLVKVTKNNMNSGTIFKAVWSDKMKKNIDKYEIISNYISSCKIIQEATLSGDYKINNAEGKKIIKVFQILEKDLKLADDCLGILLENNSIVVKTKAAAHCSYNFV